MITTKFYLDTRATVEGSAAPLKISITANRSVSYIPTGIRILPSDWNPASLKAKSSTVQTSAEIKKADVDTIIRNLRIGGKLDGLNAREIRDRVMEEMEPDIRKPERFLDVFKEFGEHPKKKERTKEIYRATLAKIEAFDPKSKYLTFADIDVGWLDRFDTFLAKTAPKKNARNIHLRNIRAVFNHARKLQLTMHYPFVNYGIRTEKTPKRNLAASTLRTLFTADLPKWQRKYVDFFQLSFLLIGMNTEDLLHVTKANIIEGRLEYIRAKTGVPYTIKIEPECQAIIDRLKGERYLLSPLDTYACTRHWTSKVNNILQGIASDLGLPKISMYWARHSWSTIALNELDIPKDTVAEALGHSDRTVTDIYIEFDRTKVDRANRQMIDFVLYGKKPVTVLDLLSRVEGLKKAQNE